jgi:hypothetical protein
MKKPFIYLLFAFCFMNCTDVLHENVKTEFVGSGGFPNIGVEEFPNYNLETV